MIFDTPIDYSYPPDKRAESVLRAIQDRECRFQRTFTSDLYAVLSGIQNEKVRSKNQLKHEWIDKRIDMLAKMNFIERLEDEKDRRRIELRSMPEEIYTSMIESEPMLFWDLLEKGYFYFIIRFRETNDEVMCPKCHNKKLISLSVSGNKASRYKVSDELHIDILLKHLKIGFNCDCGYSYSNAIDMYDPVTLEEFSKLHDAADNRRNVS